MTDCLVSIQDRMTDRYIGSTFYVALINDTRSSYNFTANATTDVITTSTPHDYILNTQVTVAALGGGALPAPLQPDTVYYVRDVSGSNLKLSATYGGAAINITDAGLGTFLITDVALDFKVLDVANYVRKELSSYDGIPSRPTVNFSSVVTTSSAVSVTQSVTLDNTTGTSGATFNALLLIKGGSNAIKNTTGKPEVYSNLAADKVVLAGASDTINVTISTPI